MKSLRPSNDALETPTSVCSWFLTQWTEPGSEWKTQCLWWRSSSQKSKKTEQEKWREEEREEREEEWYNSSERMILCDYVPELDEDVRLTWETTEIRKDEKKKVTQDRQNKDKEWRERKNKTERRDRINVWAWESLRRGDALKGNAPPSSLYTHTHKNMRARAHTHLPLHCQHSRKHASSESECAVNGETEEGWARGKQARSICVHFKSWLAAKSEWTRLSEPASYSQGWKTWCYQALCKPWRKNTPKSDASDGEESSLQLGQNLVQGSSKLYCTLKCLWASHKPLWGTTGTLTLILGGGVISL